MSISDFLRAVSVILKSRANELDVFSGNLLRDSWADVPDGFIDYMREVDKIYQELLFFSYCLGQVSVDHADGRKCDTAFLLNNCTLEKLRSQLYSLIFSAELG